MRTAEGSKVMAEFSVTPIGYGETSISSYVAAAVITLNKVKGLKCETTPMGTVMEADSLEIILKEVKVAYETLIAKGILRVVSTLRIDDRRDKPEL